MSGGWTNSGRRAELPADWNRIRAEILARDNGQCRWVTNGIRCAEAGTEVDHVGDRHDHGPGNLQALCRWHHARKTGAQGSSSPNRQRWTLARPAEKHPGSL